MTLFVRTDTNAAHCDFLISDRAFQKDRELVLLTALLPSLSLWVFTGHSNVWSAV